MQPMPSHDGWTNPYRIARSAILNGEPIPVDVQIQLAAQGVDVGELENRLIERAVFQ